MANEQNLKPFPKGHKASEEVVRRGGINSGKARREKKRISEFYARSLDEKFKLGLKEVTGWELVRTAFHEGLKHYPVQMLKELREALDGKELKVNFDGMEFYPVMGKNLDGEGKS